jgi:hypothetical protein
MSQFFEMVWTTNLVAGLVPNFPAMAYAHIYVYIGPHAMLLLSSPLRTSRNKPDKKFLLNNFSISVNC